MCPQETECFHPHPSEDICDLVTFAIPSPSKQEPIMNMDTEHHIRTASPHPCNQRTCTSTCGGCCLTGRRPACCCKVHTPSAQSAQPVSPNLAHEERSISPQRLALLGQRSLRSKPCTFLANLALAAFAVVVLHHHHVLVLQNVLGVQHVPWVHHVLEVQHVPWIQHVLEVELSYISTVHLVVVVVLVVVVEVVMVVVRILHTLEVPST
jgi:hypothetical protein